MAEPTPSSPGHVPPPERPAGPTRQRAGLKDKAKPAGWRPRFDFTTRRRIGLTAAIALALILVLVLGTFAYAFATLPDPSKLDLAGGAVQIVDRHGNLIEARNGEGQRVIPVKLGNISPFLKNATLAAEDRHFYEHHGVDWPRVFKALIVDVINRAPEEGASTITQQLAKIAILQSPQKTPLRKVRELLVATALESKYSKNQIFEMYLNAIYYGHGATGIEAASQVYFGKHSNELDLAQASLLAGLPRGPSYYDPKLHEDRAKARQRYVLDGMVSQHMITAEQADQAYNEQLNFVYKEDRNSQAPHFVDYVFEQLESQYGTSVVEKGGFKVKTTLDLTLQAAAQRAVTNGVKALHGLGADNGDLLAMDPRNGQILAMVGSADFYNDTIHGQFNVVTSERQPGSSFKPYAYEQAFKSRKTTMGNLYDDSAHKFAQGQFHDFDHIDMGWMTAHHALLLSRNIPALEVMQKAGVDDVINFAHSMGISSNLKSEVTTAIGSSAIKMIDHVAAYGAFAAGGTLHPPTAILEVDDAQGNVLDKPTQPEGKTVMTPQEAYLITYILKDYPSQWQLGWQRPMAGKSGTTDNFKDAWMMAYSPNIVVGAWVGHTGPGDPNMNGVYGTMVGRTLLGNFINDGLANAHYPVQNFQQPDGLISGPGCQQTDSGETVKSSERELYLPGTEKVCPTPTPGPTPSQTATPSPSATPLLPTPSIILVTPTPTPSAKPSSTASPAAVAGTPPPAGAATAAPNE